MYRFILPVLLALLAALSSCTSLYSSGPFGHELVPVPPAPLEPENMNIVDTQLPIHENNIFIKGNFTRAILNGDDMAYFGQAGFQHSSWIPVSQSFYMMAGGTGSAWFGNTSLTGYEEDVANSNGMLPGDWLFYGASVQGSTGFRSGGRFGYRLLLHGIVSFESGPWSQARKDFDAISIPETDPNTGAVTESKPFKNLSPTGWSATLLCETGNEILLTKNTSVVLSVDFGYGAPDLLDLESYNMLLGCQFLMRMNDVTICLMYRNYYLMNESFNMGIIYSL